jgi:hypothetical protein
MICNASVPFHLRPAEGVDTFIFVGVVIRMALCTEKCWRNRGSSERRLEYFISFDVRPRGLDGKCENSQVI